MPTISTIAVRTRNRYSESSARKRGAVNVRDLSGPVEPRRQLLKNAIDGGYVLDYKFHFGVFQNMTRIYRENETVELVTRHLVSWTPAFVYIDQQYLQRP